MPQHVCDPAPVGVGRKEELTPDLDTVSMGFFPLLFLFAPETELQAMTPSVAAPTSSPVCCQLLWCFL